MATAPEDSAIGLSDAVLDDPVFGPDVDKDGKAITRDRQDDTSRRAHLLPDPKEMAEADYAEHCTTHLKHDSRCECSLSARRPNIQHQLSTTYRIIPILPSDYCFLRDSLSEDAVTVPVVCLKPYQTYTALPADVEGPDSLTLKRIGRWSRFVGLTRCVFRNDREHALRAVLSDAAKSASIKIEHGTEDGQPLAPIVAVPEESHPGESKSNGASERAVQMVEDLVRTYKLALNNRLNMRIPMAHPIMAWLVEHAAAELTKSHEREDGLTGYERLHGTRATELTA